MQLDMGTTMDSPTELLVRIRPMTEADLDGVVAIEQRAYPFPWQRKSFADSLSAGYICTALEHTGQLVGYCILMNAVDDLHILNITVAPAYQGRGLSHLLMNHARDMARMGQCMALLLEVRPSNHHAQEVYAHLGFVRIGTRPGYYPAHQGREDAIVMRLWLTQHAAS
jgi:ribosomal-protein-alanine acetyltransferase